MDDYQYQGPWACRLTQVGDVYHIEIDLPHSIDGKASTVTVKGVGNHIAVGIAERPRRPFIRNEKGEQIP